MAKAIKGCMNKECIANKNKMNFSRSHDYCPKCGAKLSFVCKDCRMELDNGNRKYCVRCENLRKDRREQLGKVAIEKISNSAKAVGDFAIGSGKKAIKTVENVVHKK